MSNVVQSKLSTAHLKKLIKGGTVTLTPSIHNNESNHDVQLVFKTKKHKNQLSNNLRKNKGTRIHIDNLDDIKVHNGNGIFDSIKIFFNNPMTKSIARMAAPYAGQITSGLTGSPIAGRLVNSGLNAYAGSGIFDELRKVATKGYNFAKQIVAHPNTKKLIQKAAPYITDFVHKKTGSNFATEVAHKGLNHYITSGIANEAPEIEQTGSGIRRIARGQGISSPNQYVGLGGTTGARSSNNPNMHARMAMVRSHKSGGSFAPLM